MPVQQPPRIKIQNLKNRLDDLNKLLEQRITISDDLVGKTNFFHHVEQVLDRMKNMINELAKEIIQLLEIEDGRREEEAREPKTK